jgi:dUTP pyrophosphatase
MNTIRMQTTNDTARRPVRATDSSAGLDLSLEEDVVVRAGSIAVTNLPYRVAIPHGHVGILALRSSLGARGITIPNSIGIIDSDYRGALKLTLTALPGTDPVTLRAGERVAQLVILPAVFPEPVEADVNADETQRGEGGLGSTGRGSVTAGDSVNHPAHYTAYDPEVITITEHLGFCEGNVVKYLARAGRKPGAPTQLDLDKAHWYMCRIAYDKDGTFDRDALDDACGNIRGTIAALTPATDGPWQDVFNAVTCLADEIADNA